MSISLILKQNIRAEQILTYSELLMVGLQMLSLRLFAPVLLSFLFLVGQNNKFVFDYIGGGMKSSINAEGRRIYKTRTQFY